MPLGVRYRPAAIAGGVICLAVELGLLLVWVLPLEWTEFFLNALLWHLGVTPYWIAPPEVETMWLQMLASPLAIAPALAAGSILGYVWSRKEARWRFLRMVLPLWGAGMVGAWFLIMRRWEPLDDFATTNAIHFLPTFAGVRLLLAGTARRRAQAGGPHTEGAQGQGCG